jgi:hypothetical protein
MIIAMVHMGRDRAAATRVTYDPTTEDTSHVDRHVGVVLGVRTAPVPVGARDRSSSMTPPSNSLSPTNAPVVQPPELRLLLDPAPSRRSTLDGAWWPRSKDPLAELPALITSLTAQIGAITRVALNVTAWHSTPCRLNLDGRIVQLGWFTVLDPDMISVTRSHGEHIDLLVIPPESSTYVAVTAMLVAAESGNVDRPAAILASSRTPPTRGRRYRDSLLPSTTTKTPSRKPTGGRVGV